MSISHLRYEISKCREKINANLDEIKKLENRVDELKDIKKEFDKTGRKIFDYKTEKRNCYEELRYTYKDTKFAAQCADDMLECIDGRYSARAEEAVGNCIQTVEKEIAKKEQQIEDLKRENTNLRNRIQSLENEIRREERAERERKRKQKK